MIDYNKLKIAHELMAKISDKYYLSMYVRDGVEYTLCPDNENEYDMDFDNLDLLIKKLHKLTQPEPKYKVGQELWGIHCTGQILCDTVRHVEQEEDDRIFYMMDKSYLNTYEDQLYPTKAALIEAQLTYWQNLLSEEYEQHISPYCEPEYCNVSGAKLGKSEHVNDAASYMSPPFEGEVKGFKREECKHQWKDATKYFGASRRECSKCGVCETFKDFGECEQPLKQSNCRHGIYQTSCGYCQKSECQHESDGLCYTSYPPQNKCIKCGEFYR